MLIVLLCALLLDYFFGELSHYHPLVAFGHFANRLEERLNDATRGIYGAKTDLSSEFILEDKVENHQRSAEQNRLNGIIAALICLLPAGWFTYSLMNSSFANDTITGFILEVLILYFAIGLNSLKQHAQDVLAPVMTHQFEQARHALSMMVSRDTQQMDEEGLCRATTESILENGNDAVFAVIFWFIIAGAPGVVVFRLTNTLDAMWGYKTERFNHFGFFVAKLDDIMNYIPARLTAVVYALMGNWKNAMQCWSAQASLWDSPNAGVVMSAGAGALDVQLGGGDQYHGEYKERPDLGCGQKAKPEIIQQACELLNRSTILWIIIVALISLPTWF